MSEQHTSEQTLFLYLTNDLSFQEMADTEIHLENCTDCQNREAQMKKWLFLFTHESIYQMDDASLIRARNRFNINFQKVIRKKRKIGLLENFSRIIPSYIETRRLVHAVVILLFGLFLGHFLWPTGHTRSDKDLLTTLRSSPEGEFEIIPSSTRPNHVDIIFRSIEEKTFSGNLQDQDIQTTLAHSLMVEDQDILRLRIMNMLQPVSQNETVENALLHVLANDPNPGMRYRAIKLLDRFPLNDRMKNLLIRVLFQESNPGIRICVVEKLILSTDPEIMPLLKKRAEKDEYVQYVLNAVDTKNALSISRD